MPGPAPAQARRRRNAPGRGDWRPAPAIGWQHGEIPPPPGRLNAAAREAWTTWMGSWFAAYWMPDDLPGLRVVAQLYSKVCSGKAKGGELSELRQLMDNYGITPKGQQDRRWVRPALEDLPAPATETGEQGAAEDGAPYGHLRAV